MESGCDSLTHKEVLELVRQLLSWEKGGWRVKLTTHLHLLLKSRMCGALPSLPNNVTYFSFLITKLPGPLISMFFPTALIPAPWATRTSGKVRGSMDGTSSSGIPGNSARQHCFMPCCDLTTSVDWSPS